MAETGIPPSPQNANIPEKADSGTVTDRAPSLSVPPNIEDTFGSYGLLIVQVFTALGAFPVPNAIVTVSGENGVIAVLETGRDGKTPAVQLPTPNLSESFTPGTIPYALYTVSTDAVDFDSFQNVDVAVYPGITSLQRVELIPTALGTAPRNGTGMGFSQSIPPMS